MSSNEIITRPQPKPYYRPPAEADPDLALAGAVLWQALLDASNTRDEAVHADALYWLEYDYGADIVAVLKADGLVAECLNGTLKNIPDAITLAARAKTAQTWEPEQMDLFNWWEVVA